jgi:hypothetical protein
MEAGEISAAAIDAGEGEGEDEGQGEDAGNGEEGEEPDSSATLVAAEEQETRPIREPDCD